MLGMGLVSGLAMLMVGTVGAETAARWILGSALATNIEGISGVEV